MARIFIINNDPELMSLFKMWLETKSHKVGYTADAANAANLARDFKPDLLLVDQPQAAVISEIKSQIQLEKVPIILLTDYASSREEPPAGVASVIEKPFDPEKLIEKINDQV